MFARSAFPPVPPSLTAGSPGVLLPAGLHVLRSLTIMLLNLVG